MADSELQRLDDSHVEPSQSMTPRDPTPGVLERQLGRRASSYEGIGTGAVSRNASKQPSGDVLPMFPGNNSG